MSELDIRFKPEQPQISENEFLELNQEAISVLVDVIREFRTTVEEWGRQILVIYLPSSTSILGLKPGKASTEFTRKYVLEAFSSEGLPIADTTESLRDFPDRRKLLYSHYSPIGYDIVAKQIIRSLNETEMGSRPLQIQ